MVLELKLFKTLIVQELRKTLQISIGFLDIKTEYYFYQSMNSFHYHHYLFLFFSFRLKEKINLIR